MSRSTAYIRRTTMRVAVPAGIAVVAAVLTTTLAACATGFGSPTRHAVANLQAARVTVSPTLHVENVIIALPAGTLAQTGGYAYLEFTGINFSTQAENLISAGVAAPTTASVGSEPASPSPASAQLQPVGSTEIPAATASTPGSAHITVLLRGLVAPLEQGESVLVNLTFHNNGSVVGLAVPVQSAKAVGKAFLPSAPPPPLPSPSLTPSPTPAAPASSAAPASAPASSAPTSTSTSASPASSS